MFRAIKFPYILEVSLKGSMVRVKPIQETKERGIVYRTLARCEEFMAQMFLQEQAPKKSLSNLAYHFKQRGWQVQPS